MPAARGGLCLLVRGVEAVDDRDDRGEQVGRLAPRREWRGAAVRGDVGAGRRDGVQPLRERFQSWVLLLLAFLLRRVRREACRVHRRES